MTLDQPPAPATFGRVFRCTRISPASPRPRFRCYTSAVRALRVEHPDGVTAHTLFLPPGREGDRAARALRAKPRWRRWVEVTGLWLVNDEEGDAPARGSVEAAIAATVADLSWSELRRRARDLGVSAAGTRDEIEQRVVAALTASNREE